MFRACSGDDTGPTGPALAYIDVCKVKGRFPIAPLCSSQELPSRAWKGWFLVASMHAIQRWCCLCCELSYWAKALKSKSFFFFFFGPLLSGVSYDDRDALPLSLVVARRRQIFVVGPGWLRILRVAFP